MKIVCYTFACRFYSVILGTSLTLLTVHSSGNLEESFLSALESPVPSVAGRFTRSPSVSSLPVPKIKIPTRREASNTLLNRFALNSFSPFTPDYSRPQGSWTNQSRRHRIHPPVTPSTFSRSTPPTPSSASHQIPSETTEPSTDILRRSNSFQDNYASPTSSRRNLPEFPDSSLVPLESLSPSYSSPFSSRSQSPSSGFFRSPSLSKDFAPSLLDPSESLATAYPSSPPPSPPAAHSSPGSASGSFVRSLHHFQTIRLEHSSESLSSMRLEHSSESVDDNSDASTPPSFRTSMDFEATVVEEERDVS